MANPSRLLLPLLLLMTCVVAAGARGDEEIDPRWLDKLPAEDRALVDELIGYVPPAIPPGVTWIGSRGATWDDLRGQVVVVQSWTNRSAVGRRAADTAIRFAERLGRDDLVLILLHTPEGADKLQRFLERRKIETPIALDVTGTFCDSRGVFKRPVNIVIDRRGAVRYAGLRAKGLEAAVERLLAEPFDPASGRPPDRPVPEEPEAPVFPTFEGSVGQAHDVRGKRAPDFIVDEWVTQRPDATGKVVVLEFWSTTYGPCVAVIPQLNLLADRFRDRAVIVGISDEDSDDFDEGLDKRRLKLRDFQYALALDPTRRMLDEITVQAVPHCIVMSADWTVRWQGHPTRLTAEILGKIVEANDAAVGGGTPERPGRWQREQK